MSLKFVPQNYVAAVKGVSFDPRAAEFVKKAILRIIKSHLGSIPKREELIYFAITLSDFFKYLGYGTEWTAAVKSMKPVKKQQYDLKQEKSKLQLLFAVYMGDLKPENVEDIIKKIAGTFHYFFEIFALGDVFVLIVESKQ